MGERKLHAIMIGFCYQSHNTPFVNLAIHLASNGCTVTFANTEHVHHMLFKAADDAAAGDPFLAARQSSGLDIRYTTISDGFPLDFDRVLKLDEYWKGMDAYFPSRVDEFVGEVVSSNEASSFAHFLVTDTFYSWPAAICKKYGILNVSFWTQPAIVFAIDYHLDLFKQRGYFPIQGDVEDVIGFIPGVQPIKTRDLMSYFHDLDVASTVTKVTVDGFEQVKYADFILMNTVDELEHETVSALNQTKPTYAVGPMSFTTDFTKSVVPSTLWSETDCAEWLSSKPPASVLYVSFGSLAHMDTQFAAEIANGLLLSGVSFVWVVRDGADLLPDGFENDSKDQGLIVRWCNQKAVISNPAIGGFLTHCGWNSILESVWCGVPMICYPFHVDQPTNRKLVVDDWKIGINLCDAKSVDRREVADKIRQVMVGSAEARDGLRNETTKMRKMMQEALDDDGSSRTSFRQFLNDLRAKADASKI